MSLTNADLSIAIALTETSRLQVFIGLVSREPREFGLLSSNPLETDDARNTIDKGSFGARYIE